MRERTSELAVLKTVGFSNAATLALVLAESCLLAIVGGGLGLALGERWRSPRGDPTGGIPADLLLPEARRASGQSLFVLLLGLVAGIVPAVQAMRLRIVDALAEGVIMSPIRWLRQVVAVTLTAVRTIPQRRGASLATVAGIAGVVAVLVAVLSIGEGFRKTLRNGGLAAKRDRAAGREATAR